MMTNVNSGIRPIGQAVSPGLTNQRASFGMADLMRGGTPQHLVDQMPSNRGFSRGAANFQRAMPYASAARSLQTDMPANMQLQDSMFNASMLRQGQTAREQDSLGSAYLGAGFQDLNRARQLQAMPFLQMIMRGV